MIVNRDDIEAIPCRTARARSPVGTEHETGLPRQAALRSMAIRALQRPDSATRTLRLWVSRAEGAHGSRDGLTGDERNWLGAR